MHNLEIWASEFPLLFSEVPHPIPSEEFPVLLPNKLHFAV